MEAPFMVRKAPIEKTTKASRAISESVDRLAAGIDPAARAANILQLQRSMGQIDGIKRMIEQDRYCADIIIQITAARASLQVVAKSLLNAHLKACHQAAVNNGGSATDHMYQELVDLVSKMTR
jgi:CsoR family transcriptional regulator, copper-sensing transcriptional repressor